MAIPSKKILVLDRPESEWHDFLKEFFCDTASEVLDFSEGRSAGEAVRRTRPDIFFLRSGMVSLPLASQIKGLRSQSEGLRIFGLGIEPARELPYDGFCPEATDVYGFCRQILGRLPFPETIDVLVADDEPEMGDLFREVTRGRKEPAFVIRQAMDGKQGLAAVRARTPAVLILDIKMPVMDGREFFRELVRLGLDVPTIVCYDAISSEEVHEIRELRKISVIEKGTVRSSAAYLPDLVQKKVFFG
ncbi:MAG: response regulator [Candidatus Omnitrophota bacterium]